VVLVSVVVTVREDERRLEIAFDGLEAVFDIGALGREIAVAESKYLDLFLRHIFKHRSRAVSRFSPTPLIGAENDPSHDETRCLGSDAQNGSAAADLDIVGVGTQAKQPK
jgi:hypothetical protein